MKTRVIAFLLLLAATASAKSPDEFIISFWCGPKPGGDYNAKFAEVAECNFTHASFFCGNTSAEENKMILDACQNHGLKCILSDRRFSKHPADSAALTNNLNSALADYASHPATAGYFISDESVIGGFPALAGINQYLIARDPAHFPFLNLMPNWATDAQLGGTNYRAYVEAFCQTVKPRLLCYDHYALFEGNERPIYFENMEIIRSAGLRHDIPMGFIFLITPHGTYRDPNETDLRWQVNTALAYGCKALFYFTYETIFDKEANFHDGIIDPQGRRTEHYDMAQRINAELKMLGKTLINLKSTGVYHTGATPVGCTPLPPDAMIQASDDTALVIGFFAHEDGSRWAIVVNRDLHKPVSATLTFDRRIKILNELSPKDGKLDQVKLRKHQSRFELPPAGIKVLKLKS